MSKTIDLTESSYIRMVCDGDNNLMREVLTVNDLIAYADAYEKEMGA